MRQFEEFLDTELSEKLWITIMVNLGVFLTMVFFWVAMPPLLALAFSSSLVVLVNIVLRTFIALSNMALHSRAIAIQDAMVSMVHANLLKEAVPDSENTGQFIDKATQMVEEFMLEPRLLQKPEILYEKRSPFVFFRNILGQAVWFSIAAVIGIYFSADVEFALIHVAELVRSFR